MLKAYQLSFETEIPATLAPDFLYSTQNIHNLLGTKLKKMNWRDPKHCCLGLLLLCFSATALTQPAFTDIGLSESANQSSNSEWGDYDNDGDLDILTYLAGATSILRNDGNNNFTGISTGIPNISRGHITWADYDNDDDLDIAINGYSSWGKITRIYRNDGGSFTDISADLVGVDWSACSWGDYNNDGRPDLLTSGLNVLEEPVAVLYRNDGSDVFTDSEIQITACARGKLDWGDYNNDEYPDLLISGLDFDGNTTSDIYRNDGRGKFIAVNAGFQNYFRGDAQFGDYDADGDLDVALCGQGKPVRIYRNDGDNSFVEISLPSTVITHSCLDWGDFDNDGDLDLIAGGLNNNPSGDYSCLFINNGNDIFVREAFPIDGVNRGSLEWGDYDNDKDLDILATYANGYTKVYRNDNANSNGQPSKPTGLTALVVNDGAILSWKASSDDHTPAPGLSYNIRIGSAPGSGDVLSSLSLPASGNRKIPERGNVGHDTSFYIKDLALGTYYWSVQSVDGSFLGSAFSTTGSFEVLPSFETVPEHFPLAQYSGHSWGDYNNDGFPDLVLSGQDYLELGVFTKLYRNNGDYTFDTVNVNFPGVKEGSHAWGDYDNDSDLDLLLCGQTGTFPFNPLVKLFRNDGDDSFAEIDIGFIDNTYNESSWSDFDNDGDLDIVIVGYKNPYLLRNDGGDQFTNLSNDILTSSEGSLSIGDYDNDLDMDLLIAGGGSDTRIYNNTGNGTFELSGIIFPPCAECTVTFGEADNDGDLDVLYVGSAINRNTVSVYRNDGGGIFQDIEAFIRGVSEASGEWGDYNNDGYSDIFYTGRSGSFITKVYLSNQDQTYTDLMAGLYAEYRSKVSRADIDNDGDLDLFITDDSDSCRLYINNLNFPEELPAGPGNLQSENVGKGVLLSWDRPGDIMEGEIGLSYNIRMGTSPSTADVISPMTLKPTSTKKLLVDRGNADLNTSWRIDSLPLGDYYWSVQAVTPSFRGGEWAEEASFTITRMRPFFSSDTVCSGGPTSFTDETLVTGTQIASWLWEFGDGKTSASQNPQHIYDTPGEFTVKLTVTDTAGVFLSRTNPVYVIPKPRAQFTISNVCEGTLAPVINNSETDTLGIASWAWDFGDDQSSDEMDPDAHFYAETGVYNAKLTVTAENGCFDTLSSKVSVVAYPDVFITANGPVEFCEGDGVILSVEENDTYQYQWKLDGIPLGDSIYPQITAVFEGAYSVDVTNAEAECASTSSPVDVIVKEKPEIPVVAIDGYNADDCPESELISLEVADATTLYQYQWKRNGVPLDGETESLYEDYLSEGNYSVDVSNGSCKVTSEQIEIFFNEEAPDKPSIIATGPSIWYLACSNDSAAVYRWFYNDVLIEGADQSIYVADQQLGKYEVSISNGGGCFTMSDPIWIPEATSIKANPWEGLKIYPNPTPGLFTLEMDNTIMGELIIDIFQETGARIINIKFHKETSHFKTEIDLSDQPAGLYLIGLMLEEYRATRSLVVE